MTTGKKRSKLLVFSLCPLFFLCVLCGSFSFMVKNLPQSQRRKEEKTEKNLIVFPLCPLFFLCVLCGLLCL